LRIAYFSPLSPIKSGVSHYSEELLPLLQEEFDIDLIIDDYQPTNKEITSRFETINYLRYDWLLKERGYDMNIYQLGNNPYHVYIYNTLKKYPGIVVLHEGMLHHMIRALTIPFFDEASYYRELKENHGEEGEKVAKLVLSGLGSNLLYFLYPCFRRAVELSLGVIVHNRYLKDLVERECPDVPVSFVPMGIKPSEKRDGRKLKEALGLSDSYIISSFGLFSEMKGACTILNIFAHFHSLYPNSYFFIVGEVSNELPLDSMLAERGISNKVRTTGFVEKETYEDIIAITDVALNLRYPTGGETSASLLRLMSAGKPVITSNLGQFRELPDDTVIKIDPGKYEEMELFYTLELLYWRPDLRQAYGERAREYIIKNHPLEKEVEGYISFIKELKDKSKRELAKAQRRVARERAKFAKKLYHERLSQLADFKNINHPYPEIIKRAISELGIGGRGKEE